MYESLASGTSDNKVKKSPIKLNIELKRQNSQGIEVVRFVRIATPGFGEARQNHFLSELNRG